MFNHMSDHYYSLSLRMESVPRVNHLLDTQKWRIFLESVVQMWLSPDNKKWLNIDNVSILSRARSTKHPNFSAILVFQIIRLPTDPISRAEKETILEQAVNQTRICVAEIVC
jgi:hypothetical protein